MNNAPAYKRNIPRLLVDLLIFAVFVAALDRQLTGKPLHEWIPIIGTLAVILHLLLSWNWIAGVTRKFFARGALKQRLNYILNWLLFIDWVLALVSGIMVSRAALPALGIHLSPAPAWHAIHAESASFLLAILALHLALNWGWVVNMLKRCIVQPLKSMGSKRKAKPTLAEEARS